MWVKSILPRYNSDRIISEPSKKFSIRINYKSHSKDIEVFSRVDTDKEIEYFKSDGILPCVLNEIELLAFQ